MDAFLYPVLAVGYLALFVWSFRSFRESFFWGTSWVLFLILTLVYDKAILSLGIFFGGSDLFEMLSLIRNLLRVLLVPTLAYVSLDVLRRIRVEWSEYFVVQALYHIYTFCLTVLGVLMNILWVEFVPQKINGVIQYLPQETNFPLVTMLIFIPLFVSGYLVWQKVRWPILLFGVLLSIVGGTVSFFLVQPGIGAVFEFLLMGSIVLTEQMLKPEDYQENT
ncbi:hypothetical protein [Thermoactinomyces mirandus]|uniref:Uncharacterized protein n=1 Tax=Thermoactinomyces mirandus TaxID=2756294 RepID=A0A7W2AS64_9BACL|nr:hypothetical protein [Thermoactinomyces mirandus]MBA4603278.1 hypothetical protein [Thermoactinomyces mirandus]